MCRKSTTRDPWLYFPPERSHTQDFYALKNPSTPAGIEPANLGSRGKYDNHCTAGIDFRKVTVFIYLYYKLVNAVTSEPLKLQSINLY